jgi:hypothetical protein
MHRTAGAYQDRSLTGDEEILNPGIDCPFLEEICSRNQKEPLTNKNTLVNGSF